MTPNNPVSEEASLVEQRKTLRRQMLAQRQLIAYQLGPAPEIRSSYPRSMTMRLLTQRPALTAKLFGGIAALLLGARYFRSVTMALAVIRMVRSAAITTPRRLPAPYTSGN